MELLLASENLRPQALLGMGRAAYKRDGASVAAPFYLAVADLSYQGAKVDKRFPKELAEVREALYRESQFEAILRVCTAQQRLSPGTRRAFEAALTRARIKVEYLAKEHEALRELEEMEQQFLLGPGESKILSRQDISHFNALRGTALCAMNRYQSAIPFLEAVDPKPVQLLRNCYEKTGQHDKAALLPHG